MNHFATNLRSIPRRIRIVAKIAYYLRRVHPFDMTVWLFERGSHWKDFSQILGGERA